MVLSAKKYASDSCPIKNKTFNAFTADMKADKLALKDYLNNKYFLSEVVVTFF